ncbi:hypothetical protein REPUB_Repub06bG0062400 [Reevesia pubescens]
MNLVSWNIKGLGSVEKGKAVRNVVSRLRPDVIFLQESKLMEVERWVFRSVWGSNTSCFEFSSAVGTAGGIITIWNCDFFELKNKVISQRFILLVGELKASKFAVGFGNIYAPNDDNDRALLWEELFGELNRFEVAWCLGGDFNVVRFPCEKLGYRLDRFLVAASFVERFSCLSQRCLPRSLSVHNPIVLSKTSIDWGPKPFKFFNHWLDAEGFNDLVCNRWKSCSGNDKGCVGLWRQLKDLKEVIKDWQSKNGLSNFERIRILEGEIELLEGRWHLGGTGVMSRDTIVKKRGELWSMYRVEESSWQQKSRINWLRECDRNTKFFHLSASIRRRINSIDSLRLGSRTFEKPEELKEAITGHFEHHFNKKSAIGVLDIDCQFKMLSEQSASLLETPFCEEEVWHALHSCDGNKSLGPDGFNMKFLQVYWVSVKHEDSFPRIYALSINKGGMINEFGYWSDNTWFWDVKLRRNIFDWEVEQWYEFHYTIAEYSPCQSIKDSLIWKGSSNGIYSFKCFYSSVVMDSRLKNEVWKWLWVGLAPPRVEVFCWLLLKGRIAVKASLLNKGLLSMVSALCSFYGLELETVGHSLFMCSISWLIWSHFFSTWGVCWVNHTDPTSFFLQWQYALCDGVCNKIWCMCFFAICGSIWLCRNEVVFKGKLFNHSNLIEIISLRVTAWSKAKWLDDSLSVEDLFRNSMLLSCSKGPKKSDPALRWVPPPKGFLKFSVDGSSRGISGPAGIGGVLRDEEGQVQLLFSKPISCMDSNGAEVLAIKEAFLLFASSRWIGSHKLWVESDCKNAMDWCKASTSSPWKLRRWFNFIESSKSKLIGWCITHIPRQINEVADSLAKTGSNRADTYLRVVVCGPLPVCLYCVFWFSLGGLGHITLSRWRPVLLLVLFPVVGAFADCCFSPSCSLLRICTDSWSICWLSASALYSV